MGPLTLKRAMPVADTLIWYSSLRNGPVPPLRAMKGAPVMSPLTGSDGDTALTGSVEPRYDGAEEKVASGAPEGAGRSAMTR
jgi:hypothetical protein